jgi:hypothetical protein
MTLVVPHRLEQLLVRRVWRRYPHKEHIEAIFGKRVGKSRFEIALYYAFPHTADQFSCYYDTHTSDWLHDEARDLNLEYFGMIHSHIGLHSCGHTSDVDTASAVKDLAVIEGIVHVLKHQRKRISNVTYYSPWQPVAVHYID